MNLEPFTKRSVVVTLRNKINNYSYDRMKVLTTPVNYNTFVRQCAPIKTGI